MVGLIVDHGLVAVEFGLVVPEDELDVGGHSENNHPRLRVTSRRGLMVTRSSSAAE
ncbi:hypothetical protein [Streptomyces sp. NPDC059161]|uniref:hypothetical protein n=1 Tax=unclassified Streptomyces TaxID=2593676 RepID=UPI003648AC29